MPEIIYKTAYDPGTGKLLWVCHGPEETILFPEDQGFSWVDGEWSKETHYVLNEAATPRPATGLPVTHTIATNTDWIVPDVPEGTVVEIDGTEAGVVDAVGLTLAFDLAGIWQVRLRPPFPWLEASCEVTVT